MLLLTLSVSCAFLKRSYLSVPSENFFFLTAVAGSPPFIKLPRKEAMTGSVVSYKGLWPRCLRRH